MEPLETFERAFLSSCTIRDLKQIAREEGLRNYGRWTKSELVERLEASLAWKEEIEAEFRTEFPILAAFKPASEFPILHRSITVVISQELAA